MVREQTHSLFLGQNMNKTSTSILRASLKSLTLILILIICNGNTAELERLPDPLEAGWNGSKVCEKLSENNVNRILRCTFPPGIGHERHYHVAHFGYAISGGKVRITDEKGAREISLATGSSYSSNGVKWHQIQNIGQTTITYLIVETKQPAKK
jgi:hypothetical protein